MIQSLPFIAGGLLLLVAGSELLIKRASSLARRLGINPLVIGLTVVAFGTWAPELVVSLSAADEGRAEMAINIFNIGGILGLAALIRL